MTTNKPSPAFILLSWAVLATGISTYLVGLWNAELWLSEKGFYFIVLMYGLFSAISVQKSVRDRLEGIPVTHIYYGLSWASTTLAMLLLLIGLWNVEMSLSEKGFYAMSFILSLFAAITVQKNTRDSMDTPSLTKPTPSSGPTSRNTIPPKQLLQTGQSNKAKV